ncbi:MAG: hypothetical protein EA425_03730 [Puniceicoccaceae bacterium]|nr:MAG: hypothetical protein EA425_03730 [Puniceicoccaceae bacterium]
MLPGYGGWVFDLAPFLGGIGSEAAGNDRPVWFCPSTRRQSPAFSPYNLTTYAINRNLIRHPGTQHPRHLQSDQLPALSRTAFFLDGTLIAGEGADIELDPAQLNLAIASWAGNAALHGGRFNVAFLDGHLAAVPLERLINATSSGEIWALEPVAD